MAYPSSHPFNLLNGVASAPFRLPHTAVCAATGLYIQWKEADDGEYICGHPDCLELGANAARFRFLTVLWMHYFASHSDEQQWAIILAVVVAGVELDRDSPSPQASTSSEDSASLSDSIEANVKFEPDPADAIVKSEPNSREAAVKSKPNPAEATVKSEPSPVSSDAPASDSDCESELSSAPFSPHAESLPLPFEETPSHESQHESQARSRASGRRPSVPSLPAHH